jgi:hypothetical protein
MPTRRSAVTCAPRNTPPSTVVNQLCGTWRRWKSSIAAAAAETASAKPSSTSSSDASISSSVTRRSPISTLSNLLV